MSKLNHAAARAGVEPRVHACHDRVEAPAPRVRVAVGCDRRKRRDPVVRGQDHPHSCLSKAHEQLAQKPAQVAIHTEELVVDFPRVGPRDARPRPS